MQEKWGNQKGAITPNSATHILAFEYNIQSKTARHTSYLCNIVDLMRTQNI